MSELHAFLVAARLASFTRAAEHLCVTQSAISRAVSRLEAHFGQPLLLRTANGLAPTPAGRTLLAGIEAPLERIEAVSRQLRKPTLGNVLTLAAVPTLASVWLIPRLPDFHQRYPGFSIEFAPYRRDEDFSRESPQAAILAGIPEEERPGLRCDYLIGREVVVICHPDRLAARRREGRWAAPGELLQEPLITHANAPDNWNQWFRAVGVQPGPLRGIPMDQVSIIVRAVMADMGIAVLQRCLVQEEITSGRVAVPFDLPVSLRHGYVLCSPERWHDHPPLIAFRHWLLEMAASPEIPTCPDILSSGRVST